MQLGQSLLIAGGFEGEIEDTAWVVKKGSEPQPDSRYSSNAEETDTRMWISVEKTVYTNVLIRSPDTDCYHIGMTMLGAQDKSVIVQLNKYSSKELRFPHLSNLIQVLKNDPDLSSLTPDRIPQIFQTLFVSTGCDYVSYFSGIGKATFYKHFFQNAEFITSGKDQTPGTLADVSLDGKYEKGFLAFVRLVGTTYFKKHVSAFKHVTPQTNFISIVPSGHTAPEQHKIWLDEIRETTGDRSQFENEIVPSFDALYRHWRRTCWVLDMWGQANLQQMTLQPLTNFGWIVEQGNLCIDWDSHENITAVNERVFSLLKGCKCKTGCGTKRCSYRHKGRECSIGCECINCTNNEASSTRSTPTTSNDDTLLEVTVDEYLTNLDDNELADDVEDIMDWVFGDGDEPGEPAEENVDDAEAEEEGDSVHESEIELS